LALKKPTVGVAKSRLIGTPTDIEGRIMLLDAGEVVGEVVTTKKGAKPVYVSVGHMISIERAVKIIKHCSKSRIPEPLLWAHKLATAEITRLAEAKQISK
jgi:deoxyribonuclease V